MDIGPINRLRSLFAPRDAGDVRRNGESTADRDADGRQQRGQNKPQQLSPEQEAAAVDKLNALTSFSSNGLKAVLVRGDGVVTHVQIVDPSGTLIRRLSYEQLVDMYLDRHSETGTGRLLRRAA